MKFNALNLVIQFYKFVLVDWLAVQKVVQILALQIAVIM